MDRKIAVAAAVATMLVVLGAAACGGTSSSGLYGSGSAPSTQAKATSGAAKVGVGSSGLGKIVVDSSGRTLYLFEKDANGKSACNGPCAAYWPPLTSDGSPVALSGVNQSLVGTTRRADGSEQVTYAGHPLYLFALDKKPGDTNGEGLTDFGAGWDALRPGGAKIEADA
jgi:predicted lipoprotein with Yx(FWY)xxD motif